MATEQIHYLEYRKQRQQESKQPNKMGARGKRIDGHYFPSSKEARRYGQLKLLEQQGLIRKLVVHPRYELVPAFECHGEKYQAIVMELDFAYWTDDGLILEDVKPEKAFLTPMYRLKRKLFYRRYPYLKIREVYEV